MTLHVKLNSMLLVVVVCAFLSASCVLAQEASMANANADIAVPDAPAFKLLGENPSTVLRPSSIREVAVSLGDEGLTSGLVPKALSLELSPGYIVWGGKESVAAVQESGWKKTLYNLRFSIGTNAGGGAARNLAIGFRYAFHNEADMRNDSSILHAINRRVAAANDSNPLLSASPTTDLRIDYDIAALKKEFEDTSWNKMILEVGGAAMQSSPDSLLANLVVARYGLWLTFSEQLGSKGQLLFGIQGFAERNQIDGLIHGQSASATVRGYYGTNQFKGYCDGSFAGVKDTLPNLAIKLGVEARVTSGLWVDFDFGPQVQSGGQLAYTTGFKLKFGSTEN